MPRTARIAPKDYLYHVMTRGNNRQVIFKDDEDYTRYLEILQKYRQKYKFKLYHYVLMSNHVHLVLQPSAQGGALSEIMKGINLSYAYHYKKKNKHVGHFWQDRYKSIIVSEDEYLLACGSYVELNPVRACMVKDPKEYRWSSYSYYAYGADNTVLDKHLVFRNFGRNAGERQQKYRQFVKGMKKEKKAMQGVMDRRLVYGSIDFTERLTKNYAIASQLRAIGRPQKAVNEEK
jgi:REP-associated tyrosine transposase